MIWSAAVAAARVAKFKSMTVWIFFWPLSPFLSRLNHSLGSRNVLRIYWAIFEQQQRHVYSGTFSEYPTTKIGTWVARSIIFEHTRPKLPVNLTVKGYGQFNCNMCELSPIHIRSETAFYASITRLQSSSVCVWLTSFRAPWWKQVGSVFPSLPTLRLTT